MKESLNRRYCACLFLSGDQGKSFVFVFCFNVKQLSNYNIFNLFFVQKLGSLKEINRFSWGESVGGCNGTLLEITKKFLSLKSLKPLSLVLKRIESFDFRF